MKKYGLQLRIQQQNRQAMGPPVLCAAGFGDNDDDNDVNRDIARQATKKKVLKDIEEQHKKALEEDPSVFDYDGVYEQMKEAAVRPMAQDRQERKSKYIERLMLKAKEREREHEVIYERKLAKERSKDEHLFADKDKFITSAYKRKLAEQEKWLAEERLRELREEKDDVTKKSDISEFYFNLSKNVAFGANTSASGRQVKQEEKAVVPKTDSPSNSSKMVVRDQVDTDSLDVIAEMNITTGQGNLVAEEELPSAADEKKQDHHNKRKEDSALAAAKERFLARKRAKESYRFQVSMAPEQNKLRNILKM